VDVFICLQGIDFIGWEFDTVNARRGECQLEQNDRGSLIHFSATKRLFSFAAAEIVEEGKSERRLGWIVEKQQRSDRGGCIRKALDQAELMFDFSSLLLAVFFCLLQLGFIRVLLKGYLHGTELGVSCCCPGMVSSVQRAGRVQCSLTIGIISGIRRRFPFRVGSTGVGDRVRGSWEELVGVVQVRSERMSTYVEHRHLDASSRTEQSKIRLKWMIHRQTTAYEAGTGSKDRYVTDLNARECWCAVMWCAVQD
jgi:hypothetical protein